MRIDLQRELVASASKKAFGVSKFVAEGSRRADDAGRIDPEGAGVRALSRAPESLLDRASSSERPAFSVEISETARQLARRAASRAPAQPSASDLSVAAASEQLAILARQQIAQEGLVAVHSQEDEKQRGAAAGTGAPGDVRARAYGQAPGEAVDPPLSVDLFA